MEIKLDWIGSDQKDRVMSKVHTEKINITQQIFLSLTVKALEQIHCCICVWRRECDNVVIFIFSEIDGEVAARQRGRRPYHLHLHLSKEGIWASCVSVWWAVGVMIGVVWWWRVQLIIPLWEKKIHQKMCLKQPDSNPTEWNTNSVPDPFHVPAEDQLDHHCRLNLTDWDSSWHTQFVCLCQGFHQSHGYLPWTSECWLCDGSTDLVIITQFVYQGR